jgi:2-succinyl-5-enolpyruvyl-6-hydroxy-3-cyclohexene-1-carboxylate synthase
MPVRDLDSWLPSTHRSLRVLASRGANGIDGVLSAALGSAAVADEPVALVVGDLSFLHDLGGLVTARLAGSDLLVVLVDNDGGGIFSFLPQASAAASGVGLPEHFEELFAAPHGIDLGPVVESLGGTFWRVDAASLRPAVEAAVDRSGLRVLHLRTERRRNVELHRSVAAVVASALARLAPVGRVRR